MTATVVIEQITGPAPGTYHPRDSNAVAQGSGTRYMTSDQYDSSLTNYPIPIPKNYQGISGSYWVTHLLKCTVLPDTYLKDLKYYQTWNVDPVTDWSLGNPGSSLDPGLYIGISSSTVAEAKTGGSQGFPSGLYVQATGTEGVFGDLIKDSHTYYSTTCASPVSGGMIPINTFSDIDNAYIVHSGNFVTSADSTPKRSYAIVTQVLVGSGATPGNKADKTATFTYTEA